MASLMPRNLTSSEMALGSGSRDQVGSRLKIVEVHSRPWKSAFAMSRVGGLLRRMEGH